MRLLTVVTLLASLSVGSTAQPTPRITRIEFTPAPTEEGGGVIITLLGSGSCTYNLDYGDGKSDRRTADLPDRVRHTFPNDGEYLVVATPEAPCEGVAKAKLDVRAINLGVWGLSAEPGPDTENAEMVITISDRGECAVSLDYGDGTIDKVNGELPIKTSRKYPKAGIYELKAVAEPPCRGDAAVTLEVKR